MTSTRMVGILRLRSRSVDDDACFTSLLILFYSNLVPVWTCNKRMNPRICPLYMYLNATHVTLELALDGNICDITVFGTATYTVVRSYKQ